MSSANIGILPAGSVPPVSSLPDGVNAFVITSVQAGEPRSYYYIQFPDGFKKTFQCTGLEELTSQISGLLRGRYGVESVVYTKVPSDLIVDETIEITI